MLIPTKFPVTSHTDHVGKGSIFVAIKGHKKDGANFIDLAIKKGASKIVLGNGKEISKWSSKYPGIKFSFANDTRETLAILASKKLDNPSSKLKIIGVTGTKGKTTTTFLINHILHHTGHKTALLGTIKSKILNRGMNSPLTTMGADFIQMFLNECIRHKVEYVILEVSSHALSLKRIFGIELDVACFTNLAPEHMDFYKNLDDYFSTKCILFNQIKNGGIAIINSDNQWGKKLELLLQKKQRKLETVSLGKKISNIDCNKNYFYITKNSLNAIEINLNSNGQEEKIFCPRLFGKFNAYNLATAVLSIKALKIKFSPKIFKNFPGIPGRLQMHKLKNEALAFVDFAHNASSFENILQTLRAHTKHLIVIFGCGGNRDKTKRPKMGIISSVYSDEIILTNDNPRSENPNLIVEDIICDIPENKKKAITVELDRRKAIKKAITKSQKDSIIVILGRGHEKYQIIKDKKTYFNDFEEISLY